MFLYCFRFLRIVNHLLFMLSIYNRGLAKKQGMLRVVNHLLFMLSIYNFAPQNLARYISLNFATLRGMLLKKEH